MKNVMGKMVCYFHTTQINVNKFTNMFFFSGSTVEPQAKLIFERQRCIQVGQCSCVAVGVWLQFGCLSFERSSRKQGQNAADPNHSPSSCCFEGVECSHVASC